MKVKFSDLPDESLIRLPLALAMTGWGKTRFYQGVKDGEIPKPVHLGERARAWKLGDIRQYLQRLGSQSAQGGAS